jgi:peptidoglycan/xylan/chitin deacetylase (PgdA/CDA1 family)
VSLLTPGRAAPPARDRLRTARLLFDAELLAGRIDDAQLSRAAARGTMRMRRIAPRPIVPVAPRPVAPRPVRLAQQVLYKLGVLGWERSVAGPLRAVREGILGERASAPPRFLVRVDEFPHYRAWDEPQRFGTAAFQRFHEIMQAAGVPYLLAVLPRVCREPLSPAPLASRSWDEGEIAMARRLQADGVAFAAHGLDHRTRFASPRRHSELCGLTIEQTEALVERALGELEAHGLRPSVFVAPYNRFDVRQLAPLARRFDVLCGGPESIGTLGFRRPPEWRGQAVYLPAYAPFYGRAETVLAAAQRAIERADGLWIPLVLHWGWEAQDGWGALERLAARIAPYASPWGDFLAAVARSRGEPA